eukprot:764653-Hanusia_phi.AAC.3
MLKVSPDQTSHQLSATIAAHEGPIWQVAWAHPKFGSILASCSYDRKVCVWKEVQLQQWTKIYEYADHQSSVNSIAFAPHELGLKLAAASADGTISILSWRGAGAARITSLWVSLVPQDKRTTRGTSGWCTMRIRSAATRSPGLLLLLPARAQRPTPHRSKQVTWRRREKVRDSGTAFVSGGCDGVVRIWRIKESGDVVLDEEFNRMYQVRKEEGETRLLTCSQSSQHSGWVRDVAWAPSLGLPVQVT